MKVLEKIIDDYYEYRKDNAVDPRVTAFNKMKSVILDALCELDFTNEMEHIIDFSYNKKTKIIYIETSMPYEGGTDEHNIDMSLVDFDTIVEVYRGFEKSIQDLNTDKTEAIVNKKEVERKRAALETLEMDIPIEITTKIIDFNTVIIDIHEKIRCINIIKDSIIT